MQIIPAFYLQNNHIVTWYKGLNNDQSVEYHKNPVSIIRRFVKDGATRIHLVDLDGSAKVHFVHHDLVKKIIQETALSVQVAGGIRSLADIEQLLKAGVTSLVLGYSARDLIKPALAKYGPAVIYGGIKARRGQLDTDETADLDIVTAANQYKSYGITDIVYKDLESEGTFHPNFDEVDRLITATGLHIYTAGGIGDINQLKVMKRINVTGVIISRALLEGRLSFKECQKMFE